MKPTVISLTGHSVLYTFIQNSCTHIHSTYVHTDLVHRTYTTVRAYIQIVDISTEAGCTAGSSPVHASLNQDTETRHI